MSATRRTGPMRRRRSRRGWAGYLFASPWLVGFFGLTLLPIVASLLLSLVSWNGVNLKQIEWVAADNYRQALQDELVAKALWNTAFYSFIAVPLGLVVSLALAVLLNQKLRGIHFFRTIFYMPHVIGGVATIMMWMWVFNPDFGVLNSLIRAVAWPLQQLGWVSAQWQPPKWLYDPSWSKPSLIIMSVWGAGGAMLIFLAALQNVPQQLYEAADIDGAGRWRKFRHITVPQISPAIFFNLVMGIIGSFQVFNQAYIISGGTGRPAKSTLFYVLYLYQQAFHHFRMGYASALAWILFVIILALTLIVLRSSVLWVYYEGEEG